MEYLNEKYVKVMSRLQSEKGATMVEYALVVALIAVVCIIAYTLLGTRIQAAINDVAGRL